MRLRPVSIAILALMAGLATSASADSARRSYIIQLADKPVASYDGQLSGLAATQPAAGQRLNVDAAAVQNYIAYLDNKQRDVLSTVAGAPVTHRYKVVFNGFAALLTDDEVRALKKHGGVAAISADSLQQLDTTYTPSFLGLDQPGGLWSRLGGQGAAGENVIVGIVDSGIWPEHPSFADRVDGNGVPSHSGSTLAYGPPPANWKGTCQTGEGFTAAHCNNKLIGARFFNNETRNLHWTEFASPRDSIAGPEGHGGHGTHVASTAAGNANVPVDKAGVTLGVASGVAPRARIAAYKVCWTDATSGRNSCPSSNGVAALEQAVIDGVHVVNYSIGPGAGGGAFNDPIEVAFLGAAAAGVFVATSAGNNGPEALAPAPTAHLSPWVTSVANSTHDRLFAASLILGNGVRLTGASSNGNIPAAPLIRARDAGLPGVDPADPNLLRCFGPEDNVEPLLDPVKVAGKVLVCDRGNNVLVNKSANGKTAGAVGVVIANVPGGNNSIINQAHSIATIHLKLVDSVTLKAYIDANPTSATAAMGDLRAVADPDGNAPVIAALSSRGPNVANASILKPDIAAPGSDILAGVTDDVTRAERDAIASGTPGRVNWEFYSGTSMASPHIAGMAALLRQLHPGWSPAYIKSALMTTATPTKSDGRTDQVPWDTSATYAGTLPFGQGAGQAAPNRAASPGLVYGSTEIDWARFLCGINVPVYSPATCRAIGTILPHNLNLASLTASAVLGRQTLTRTVTNVSAATATFTAGAELPGYTVDIQPATLTLAPGQRGTFRATLARTSAPLDTWSYGSLTWTGAGATVRSPLTARATALAAPATVSSEAATGSKLFTIGTGFTGQLSAIKSGLLPATRDSRSIGESGTESAIYVAACRAGGGPGVNVHSFPVAAGTLAARFSLYDEDTEGGSDSDLDLVVIDSAGNIVASSGNGGSNERVHLNNPAPDTYRVCVIGYAPVGGDADYTLSSWVLAPNAINGGFKALLPGVAYLGGTGTVSMSWANLAAGQRHLGALRYVASGVAQGTTVVEVDTSDPLPPFANARAVPAQAR